MMRRKGMLAPFFLLLCLFTVRALAGCSFNVTADYTVNAIQNFTVPLAASAISVPTGAALGSIIFQQRIYLNSTPFSIKCDTPGTFQRTSAYAVTPMGETSAGSQIYQTNVAGIGIRFYGSSSFPYTFISTTCVANRFCDYYEGWFAQTYIQFIKTADVSSGGVIKSIDIPTAIYSAGQNDSMVNIYKINVTGNLSVNVPTCDVALASQSMVVQMGSHKASEFSGKGSGTDWKKVAINLSNCDAFYGNSSTSVATFDGTNNTATAELTRNRAKVTLSFYETPVDPAEGIMAIDSSSQSATGIGIQLSREQDPSRKINLNSPFSYNLTISGSQTRSLIFYARYIQTSASAPLPGKANGKLEFVVSYE